MAPKRGIKRKDKSRVVLKKGESQRKDGTYDYRWTLEMGEDTQSMPKHWKNFVLKKTL